MIEAVQKKALLKILSLIFLCFFVFQAHCQKISASNPVFKTVEPESQLSEDAVFKIIETGSDGQIEDLLTQQKSFIKLKRGTENETLLMAALKADRSLEVIRFLVRKGANVSGATRSGKTPLMYAAEYSSTENTAFILNAQSFKFKFMQRKRILKKDDLGKNAYTYALLNNAQTAAYLEQYLKDKDKKRYAQVVCADSENPACPLNAEEEDEDEEASLDEIQPELPEITIPEGNIPEVYIEAPPPIPQPQAEEEDLHSESKSAPESPPPPVFTAPLAQKSDLSSQSVPSPIEIPDTSQDVPEKKEKTSVSDSYEAVEPFKKTYLLDYVKLAEEDDMLIPEEYTAKTPFNYIDDADSRDLKGQTMLMRAAKEGNIRLALDLLYSNADVNASDDEGWTPLMFAVRFSKNADLVNLLLNAGADFKAKNNYGVCALKLAAGFCELPEITEMLLAHYSSSDSEVRAAFIFAVECGAPVAVLEKFTDTEIFINSPFEGKTALMYAAQTNKSTEIIAWLLNRGAKKTYITANGMTAYDFAKSNKLLPRDEIYWSLKTKTTDNLTD